MPNPTYIPALPSERSNKEDKTRECAWPGCAEKGEYKAPKTREKIRKQRSRTFQDKISIEQLSHHLLRIRKTRKTHKHGPNI